MIGADKIFDNSGIQAYPAGIKTRKSLHSRVQIALRYRNDSTFLFTIHSSKSRLVARERHSYDHGQDYGKEGARGRRGSTDIPSDISSIQFATSGNLCTAQRIQVKSSCASSRARWCWRTRHTSFENKTRINNCCYPGKRVIIKLKLSSHLRSKVSSL